MTSLEDRIRRLEDIEAVRVLMARYQQACDGWRGEGTHRDPAAIAELFTEDGIWDVTAREPAPCGHEAIAALAKDLQVVPWIVHMVLNPIVDVDGDVATAQFKALTRVKRGGSSEPMWSLGNYRAVASRTLQGWRFRSLLFEPLQGSKFDPPR